MMKVKLSIIVPVFNVEKYLRDCLDSLVVQDLQEMEIICVDDGSTDGSTEILKEYQGKYNKLIKVVRKENGGLSAARNRGLETAEGKYVVFVDSDDLWASNREAAYIVKTMEEEKLDVLLFGIQPFYENSELERQFGKNKEYYNVQKNYGFFEHGYELLKAIKEGNDYLSSACVKGIKREVLIRENIKFFEGIIHEDELFSFILMMSTHRCRHTKRVIYLRRYRNGSMMTSKHSFKNLFGNFVVWRESLNFLQTNAIPKDAEGISEEMLSYFEKNLRSSFKRLESEERKKIYSFNIADHYLLLKIMDNSNCFSYDDNPFVFPYHLVPAGSRVILYGAGDVGQHMWRQIQREGIVVPVAMLDGNAKKLKQDYVYPIAYVNKLNFDYIVISIKDGRIAKEVKMTLVERGVRPDIIKWDGESYDIDKFHRNVLGTLLKRL